MAKTFIDRLDFNGVFIRKHKKQVRHIDAAGRWLWTPVEEAVIIDRLFKWDGTRLSNGTLPTLGEWTSVPAGTEVSNIWRGQTWTSTVHCDGEITVASWGNAHVPATLAFRKAS